MEGTGDILAQKSKAIDAILGDETERKRLLREIVRRFDVEFDLPLRHDYCLGLLMLLGATEPPAEDDMAGLTAYLGAATCRIARADIAYQYMEGLEAIEDSRVEADRLRRLLDEGRGTGERTSAACALARWLDAAAKIDYRLGDFTTARLKFGQAVAVAENAGILSILPDLRSNKVRAAFEEQRSITTKLATAEAASAEQAAAFKQLRTTYAKLKDEVLGELEQRGLPEPPGWTDELRKRAFEDRELLRGFSNVLHNHSIALEGVKDYPGSLSESALSERLCRVLGDDYRLSQALLHQGRILFQQKDYPAAKVRFEELGRSPWKRGQRIAQQWLARIAVEAGEVEAAVDKFQALFADFERERARRGAAMGSDLPFEATTADHFDAMLQASADRLGDRASELLRLGRRERLRAVCAVRRVIKVTSYKRDYAKYVRPTLLREAAIQLRQEPPAHEPKRRQQRDDNVLRLVEEATARELLDTLAEMRKAGDLADEVVAGDTPAFAAPSAPPRTVTGPTGGEERSEDSTAPELPIQGPRRSRRAARLTSDEVNTIEQQRQAFERDALDVPVATVQINPEIAHAIRMFTADDNARVVVRYIAEGESDRPARLRAFVARGGRSFLSEPLDIARVRRVAKRWTAEAGPPRELAEIMFSALIRPLWADFGHVDATTRLVIIPTDDLLGLPMHVALGPETGGLPLGAVTQLCFSVSAAAHVDRSRHLLARFPVDHDDDLFVFMVTDKDASGRELIGLEWPSKFLHLCGEPPLGLARDAYTPVIGEGLSVLERLTEIRPEFYLHSGHGKFDHERADLGPVLEFGNLRFTQFDVARRIHLPRNKLTLLAACVTGQGAEAAGGEVGGFLRAFMAAGSGAIGVTLWKVLDSEIAGTVRSLLHRVSESKGQRVFDVVAELRAIYAKACDAYASAEARIEACPLALYL